MFKTVAVLSLFVAAYARLTAMEGRFLAEVAANNGRDTFCSNPTPKAKVNFPDKFIGRAKVEFEMYSGYINVTTAPDYLFYWFFSSRDGNPNAPLIIWTNGMFNVKVKSMFVITKKSL